MHCAVIQISCKTIAPVLLIVGKEVLGTGLNTNALYANNGLISTFTIEVWVRAEAVR